MVILHYSMNENDANNNKVTNFASVEAALKMNSGLVTAALLRFGVDDLLK